MSVLKMADSDDDYDIINCPVCFESYEETGDHIPRLLPCSHTLCEKCTATLLLQDSNSFNCPECLVKHVAHKGVRSYPQNKYILTNIRRTKVFGEEEPKIKGKFEQCKEHRREASLYCNASGCQKLICPVCLLNDHKTHNVVDILYDKEEKVKAIFENLELITKGLKSLGETILAAKQNLQEKYKDCLIKLNNNKEEQIRQISNMFDKLTKDASDQMKKVNRNIDDEVATIVENLVLIDSIRQNTSKETPYNEMRGRLEIIDNIKKTMRSKLSESRTYKYLEYNGTEATKEGAEMLCGHLIQKVADINLAKELYHFNCKGKKGKIINKDL